MGSDHLRVLNSAILLYAMTSHWTRENAAVHSAEPGDLGQPTVVLSSITQNADLRSLANVTCASIGFDRFRARNIFNDVFDAAGSPRFRHVGPQDVAVIHA